MIHPYTYIKYINDAVGHGIFAAKAIPKGTIVYVKDPLDIELKVDDYAAHRPEMQDLIEKYSFIDQHGVRILCWDLAKYVNHCCHCNTLSSGFGFDIAIKDINEGEEITCDYGPLNVEFDMKLVCQQSTCRNILKPSDIDTYFDQWDEKLKPALNLFTSVEQPLVQYMNQDELKKLLKYLQDPSQYISVHALKYHEQTMSRKR